MLLSQAHLYLQEILNLSSFDVFDFLFQEHFTVVFFHGLQKSVDPRLKVFWAVFAWLNQNGATKNLRIGCKTRLNNVTELFIGSKSIETGLFQAAEYDS